MNDFQSVCEDLVKLSHYYEKQEAIKNCLKKSYFFLNLESENFRSLVKLNPLILCTALILYVKSAL